MQSQFRKRPRVLTVGDGDLTFTLALSRAFGPDQLDITASVLIENEGELTSTYTNASDALNELRSRGVEVKFGIDAARLDVCLCLPGGDDDPTGGDGGEDDERTKASAPHQYDVIMFNHPHLGTATLAESERRHALRHHSLISHYLHSASKCLTDRGVVHLCLCGSQPQTWDVAGAASTNGLELYYECGTTRPVHDWLLRGLSSGGEGSADDEEDVPSADLTPLPVLPGYPAPRRYRNGRLGSRHFLGRYGYRHRRTRGDVHGGNEADVVVDGSANLLFRRKGSSASTSTSSLASSQTAMHAAASADGDERKSTHCCRVCGVYFDAQDALRAHLAAPALPDVTVSAYRDEETGRDFSTLYALKTYQRQKGEGNRLKEQVKRNDERGDKRQRVEPAARTLTCDELVANGTRVGFDSSQPQVDLAILEEATVEDQFDGKRLRWYCRQPSIFTSVKSKKLCDDMIKAGRICVNGISAFDSARIVRSGDSVSIVAPSMDTSCGTGNASNRTGPGDGVNSFGVRIVKAIDPGIVIAYKPVGLRSAGSFSSQTLEMVVPTLLDSGKTCVSLTKLETGCAGLCVLATTTGKGPPADVSVKNLSIAYVFTALVYGHAPTEWSRGVYINIPQNFGRRWKRNGAPRDDEGNEAQLSTNDELDEPSLSLAESDPNTEQIFVQCTERTIANGSGASIQVSTLQIRSTAENGRLCNIICYLLRKLNHAVVNDRFCKREFAALPRFVRNHIKKKLCIALCRVELKRDQREHEREGTKDCSALEVMETDVPDRLRASWWEEEKIAG